MKMPTPPDQNIPRMHLPPWEPYEARKKRAAGLQQPGPQQPPAPQGAATPAAGPKAKVYIIPPYSFSFDFGGGLRWHRSSTGFSFEDMPWATPASKIFSGIATGLDALGLGLSAASTLVGVVGPFTGHPASILAAKGLGLAIAKADVAVGEVSTAATHVADVLAGNTGFAYQGQHYEGIAYGRDSIVSLRNLVLGAFANLGGALDPELVSQTAINVAGTYISASQLDHDIEGWMGKEGGSIVFTSFNDAKAGEALKEQMLDDWFLFDKSPALESWVTTQTGSHMEGMGMGAAGRAVREFGERWGQTAPAQP
jgi:hypothetical protein